MNIDLSGRRALVTGSTAGIGYAVAAGLAQAGAHVFVNGRSQARAEEAARRIGEAAEPAAGDVGTAEGCEAILRAVPDVDILVNNAGVFSPLSVFEIPDEEWRRIFDVNVLAGVRLARRYVPRMVERGWGRVIFISSESALQIPAEMVHYGMSKTAQLAIARGMAESVPGSGVTVNSVLPGPTRSEGVERFLQEMSVGGTLEEAERQFLAEHRPTQLLGRMSTPEEVANLVVYVASEQASATTGAALRADGGTVRAIP